MRRLQPITFVVLLTVLFTVLLLAAPYVLKYISRGERPITLCLVGTSYDTSWRFIELGAVKAAKELGVDLITWSSHSVSVVNQGLFLRSLKVPVDGVVLLPQYPDLAEDFVKYLRELNIPVVTVLHDVDGRVLYFGVDYWRVGYVVGKVMAYVLHTRNVSDNVVIAIVLDSPFSQRAKIIDGFTHGLKSELVSGYELSKVVVIYSFGSADVVVRALANVHNLAGIFCVDVRVIDVVVEYVTSTKVSGCVIIAYGLTSSTLDYLKSGSIDAVVIERLPLMGYYAVYFLFNASRYGIELAKVYLSKARERIRVLDDFVDVGVDIVFYVEKPPLPLCCTLDEYVELYSQYGVSIIDLLSRSR